MVVQEEWVDFRRSEIVDISILTHPRHTTPESTKQTRLLSAVTAREWSVKSVSRRTLDYFHLLLLCLLALLTKSPWIWHLRPAYYTLLQPTTYNDHLKMVNQIDTFILKFPSYKMQNAKHTKHGDRWTQWYLVPKGYYRINL